MPPNEELEQTSDPFLDRFLPGDSPAVVSIRAQVKRLNSTRNIALMRLLLIRGETGAGKTYLAAVIAGHRKWLETQATGNDAPLTSNIGVFTEDLGEIHLPNLPDDLVESELFGHRKGAFTGAEADKSGLLGATGSGKEYKDVLLDEVGDASPALQAKLLAVVEHGRFRPLGAEPGDERETGARLLLATNRDLEDMVRKGEFREDLYWRARVLEIRVPPLREQPENIEPIAIQILEDLRELPVSLAGDQPELSPADREWARRFTWPGNIRTLRHAIRRWLFEGGEKSLEQVVADLAPDQLLEVAVRDLRQIVASRLDAALAGRIPPPGTPGGLVDEFSASVREAASRWYQDRQLDENQIKTVFPNAGVASVRAKISKWKAEYE